MILSCYRTNILQSPAKIALWKAAAVESQARNAVWTPATVWQLAARRAPAVCDAEGAQGAQAGQCAHAHVPGMRQLGGVQVAQVEQAGRQDLRVHAEQVMEQL